MKTAVLIAWPEPRFEKKLKQFETYLKSLGVSTDYLLAHRTWDHIIASLRKAVERVGPGDVLLVVFEGHGGRIGWGAKADKGRNPQVKNSLIARMIGEANCPAIVVSNACFGARIVRELRRTRERHDTCLIAPWDAKGICYGGAVEDILTYWPQSKRPEDEIGMNIYSSESGDRQVPVLFRWGAHLDHHFFPTMAQRATI